MCNVQGANTRDSSVIIETVSAPNGETFSGMMFRATQEPAFNQDVVAWLGTSKEAIYSSDDPVPRFFVCVDPNGGALSSDMVITSCAYVKINDTNHMVVLGVDTHRLSDGLKIGELLRSHILAVRCLKGFEHATAVVIVDSNPSFMSFAIAQYITDSALPNVIMMRDNVSGKSQHAGIEMLRRRFEERAIRVHEHVASSPQLFEQLYSFKMLATSTKRNYSGKIDGKTDDYPRSLANNCHCHDVFVREGDHVADS